MQIDLSRKPRPTTLVLSPHSTKIVLGILIGDRHHRDLKIAFDWSEAPEPYSFWAEECHSEELSMEARVKLARAVKLDVTKLKELAACSQSSSSSSSSFSHSEAATHIEPATSARVMVASASSG